MNLLGPRLSRETHVVEREFEGGDKSCPRNKKNNRPYRAVFFLFLVVCRIWEKASRWDADGSCPRFRE